MGVFKRCFAAAQHDKPWNYFGPRVLGRWRPRRDRRTEFVGLGWSSVVGGLWSVVGGQSNTVFGSRIPGIYSLFGRMVALYRASSEGEAMEHFVRRGVAGKAHN